MSARALALEEFPHAERALKTVPTPPKACSRRTPVAALVMLIRVSKELQPRINIHMLHGSSQGGLLDY